MPSDSIMRFFDDLDEVVCTETANAGLAGRLSDHRSTARKLARFQN